MAFSFLIKGHASSSPLQGKWLWPHAYRMMCSLPLNPAFLSPSFSYDCLLSGLLPSVSNFHSVRPFTGLAPSIKNFTTYCLCLCLTLRDHCLYRHCLLSLNYSTDSYFSWPIAEVFQYMLALIANSRLGYTCHHPALKCSSLKTTHFDINNYNSIAVAYSQQITLHNHKIIAHQDNTSLILKCRVSKTESLSSFLSITITPSRRKPTCPQTQSLSFDVANAYR
jgi:hypothetical protein